MKRIVDSVLVVLGIAIAGCGSSGGKAGAGGAGGAGGGKTGAGGAAGHVGSGGAAGGAAVDGGTCSFTPCGGDIVGTWHFAGGCGSLSIATCPDPQRVVIEHETANGTYTFASDGTFMTSITGTFSETVRYPAVCLPSQVDAGNSDVCTAYQNQIQASVASSADAGALADAGFAGLMYTCAMDVTATCGCTETFTYLSPHTTTAFYAVSGDQVVITTADGGTADAGTASSVSYCVSGNTLTLEVTSTTAGSFVITLTR